jgi:PAS domain S-box-containing protein
MKSHPRKRFTTEVLVRARRAGQRLLRWADSHLDLRSATQSVGAAPDIAPFQEAEEKLRERERQLELIMNAVPELIFYVDAQSRYVSVNNAFEVWFGVRRDAVIGRTVREFVGEDAWKYIEPNHSRALAGERVEYEDEVPYRQGTRWVRASYTPHRNTKGSVVGIVVLVSDITASKRADEHARASEQRYALALKATNEAVWDLNVTTGAVQWNDVYAQMFGRTEDTQESLQWWIDHIHPDDREHTVQSLRDALAGTADSWICEYRFRRANGGWAFLLDRAYIARDALGKPYRMVGAMQDLTERKLMEQALNTARQRFESLVRTSAQIVWTTNARGQVEEDSPTWREITGQTHEQIKGWGWLDALHPDDRERVRRDWQHHATTTTLPLEIEYRIRNHHTDHWRWMLVRAVSLMHPDGTVAEWVGMSTDITERKQAEELVRASEERLQMALEAARTAAYAYDPTTGAITFSANAIDVLGTPPAHDAEAIALMHPDDIERHKQILARVAAQGGAYRNRYRRRIAPGEKYHWFDERGRAECDAAGHTVRLIGVVTDITAQVQAEEALHEVDRRKDEFLATLAHELRNPLAPVRTAVQILKLKGPPVREVQWATDVIGRQTQVMARLIDDLMDVSRINRGKIELKRERIDLAVVIQSAVETSRPLIEEMKHQLIVNLPSEPVPLYCDATRLAQVLLNLLNNAAKYMERGGRIFLNAERQQGEVVISVKDTGIGIPPEKLPTLFEMFSQVETALSRSRGGLGIGLSLVHKLVAMHGGHVSAHSEGPGKGSEFIVRLPIASEPEHKSADGTKGTMNNESAKLRILVVDDNEDATESLAMMLTILGHQAYQAYDGEAGIEAARENQPDVVLCDIGLPKRNGYEVCRSIRREPWGRNMVLVAVTGWGQDSDRKASKEAGFDYHLVKPVDSKELMKLLAGVQRRDGRPRAEESREVVS